MVDYGCSITPVDSAFEQVLIRISKMEIEHFFTCPYCWQEISMVLDASVSDQTYIEDCEICCRPISIRYTVEDREMADFTADSIDE